MLNAGLGTHDVFFRRVPVKGTEVILLPYSRVLINGKDDEAQRET